MMNTITKIGVALTVAVAFVSISCVTVSPTTDEVKIQALREYNAGQYDKARVKLQTVLYSHPTDADCLYHMGRIMHMEGKLDRAIFYYKCCLDSAPGYPQAASYLKLAELDADVQSTINTTTAPSMR